MRQDGEKFLSEDILKVKAAVIGEDRKSVV